MVGWNDELLMRRSKYFDIAHGLLKLLAILVGLTASTVCLMAVAGILIEPLIARAAVALIPCLVLPGLVAKWLRPKEDALRALGLPSETYALMLLGFSVLFVVAAHERTAGLLVREGDRCARQNAQPLARIAWFLANTQPPPP